LIMDNAGALYGTTSEGGTLDLGTVFQLTPPPKGQTAWTPAVLHSFTGFDGTAPVAGLIFDSKGALYGTTSAGGTLHAGTVFKLTPPATGQTKWIPTVLWQVPGGSFGASPKASLSFDSKGVLYGTNNTEGEHGGGTVFKLTPPTAWHTAWTPDLLHSFNGDDGVGPRSKLIIDSAGALYGTTAAGGTNNNGTVYKLAPPITFLNSKVAGVPDGAIPQGGLIVNLVQGIAR
jgi:uncharacterized repeat protein (TIGR03803 family)